MLTINKYGTPDTWDDVNTSSDRTGDFWNRLKPYLNITKECNYDNRFACWDVNDYFYYLNGSKSINHIHNGNQKTFILNDGTMVSFSAGTYYDTGCSRNDDYFSCADIFVKTDNQKKQIFGKNIFVFRFEHSVLAPSGKNADMTTCSTLGNNCTAWAIFNENMEYTKCNDLSWSGKKKCN